MTTQPSDWAVELLPCPGCNGTDTRVIGGPGTRGGPQYWAGCDHCRWRTWGNTEREAIDAWNARAPVARELDASGDAPRAAEAGDWLPIESAPRDGSYILVANSHGAWVAKWHPVYQSGYRPSNPWASMMLNHDHIEKPGRFDHPTHWRELTPPRAAMGAVGAGD